MSISFDEERRLFKLGTKNSAYQFTVDKTGCLRHLYYGGAVGDTDMGYRYRTADRGFSGNPYEQALDRGCSFDLMPQEYSSHGVGDFRVSSLITEAGNGSRSLDLRYSSHEIREGKYTLDGLPYVRGDGVDFMTLIITLKDSVTGVCVKLSYGVLEEEDIITRTARITNSGSSPLRLYKAASLCLDFPFGELELIHFSGRHCMERIPERTALRQDITVIGSKRGMSSHHSNPFVILCEPSATEDTGDSYGLMFMYSGNHKTEIERDQTRATRVVMGINDEDFCYGLAAGESFQTPEVILSFSQNGLNGLSENFHRVIREHVCPPSFRHTERPVLLNSWEAAYFNFDDKKLLSLADSARDIGVDLFVLDDGWFGSRDNDRCALGDWFVNERKLKGGLKPISDHVHDLGMKFGLWLEPEMISEDSALYREHPDWALRDPGRPPMVSRNQLVLDMSRADVRDHLFERISHILSESRIEYIKWDFNRAVANVYSAALSADRQGETAHRFVLGTYELLGRIESAFPDVMIEGCAGGGGRFDAGMLFYCPQIWCSDNTDAIARLKIQRGTSYGYPVCTMGSHVSASPNHQTGRSVPLFTRAVVAMSGTFGYELDPDTLTDDEKNEIRAHISTWRRYEGLIREGTLYRLSATGALTAWEFVMPDRSEALVNVVAADVEANPTFALIRLKGLDELELYQVDEMTPSIESDPLNGLCASGSALMRGGITLPPLSGDYPAFQILIRRVRK